MSTLNGTNGADLLVGNDDETSSAGSAETIAFMVGRVPIGSMAATATTGFTAKLATM